MGHAFLSYPYRVKQKPCHQSKTQWVQDPIPRARLFSPAWFHSLGARTNLEFARRWMEPRFIRLHTLWSFHYEHYGPSKECSWHSLTEEPDSWLPRWQLCCFCRAPEWGRWFTQHRWLLVGGWALWGNILDISWLHRSCWNYAWDTTVNSSLMWTKLPEESSKDEKQVLVLFLIWEFSIFREFHNSLCTSLFLLWKYWMWIKGKWDLPTPQ